MPDYVGLLHSGNKNPVATQVSALNVKLGGTPLTDKYAQDDPSKLEDLAEDFVDDPNCKVIIAAGGSLAAVVAQQVTERQNPDPTKRKPVVFTTVQDPGPQGLNLVQSFAFPGGNLTGTAGQTSELDPTRLKLLVTLLGTPSKIGVLLKRDRKREYVQYQSLGAAATKLNIEIMTIEVSTAHKAKKVFKFFHAHGAEGVLVGADSLFNSNRSDILTAARDASIPTIYQWRQFVDDGGLISYGPDITEAYENAGTIAKQIFQGNSTPDRIPCRFPAKYELVMNTSTAASLSIAVPATLMGITVQQV
jgi:putative ABC transport system substrate-binding protein